MSASDRAAAPEPEQFRALFDLMPQLGWTARPDGHIDFYNRGWYEYTGTTFEQMQGWGWQAVHDPEILPKVIEQWQRSLATGTPFEMEFPLRRHDGVFRWFLTRVNPLRDADGNIIRWVGINADIDDRRQHVRMLERLSHVGRTISADMELQTVLQAVTDAATELSGAHFGAFFYNVVNPAGEAYMLYTISGVPREAFEKFPMPRNTALFGPTFAGEATVLIDDVHKDARFGKNPPYHGMPEGHLPVVSYLAVPVISRSGEVMGGLFFGHPRAGVFTLQSAQVVEGLAAQAAVTLDNARLYRRVVADRALVRQSEARYRTLVEASPTAQAVGTSNPEGYVIEDSPSWRALTGQTFEEMRGRGWLQAVHPAFREAAERELDAAIADRRIYLMEFRLRMSDGTYRWFASKGVPVYDDDGVLREWIGTTSDIDQRRSTEEHLRFLARANELFASSLDYESTLRNLTQAAVPALADWCAVDMTVKSTDGAYERLAVAHVDPEKTDLAWEIYRTYKADLSADPIAQAIRSGKSQLVREIPDELLRSVASSAEHYAVMKELGLLSFMIVPLLGRRGALGAITFVSSDSLRLFTELDLSHAEEFARRAAVAIENAMLYRDAQDANRAKDDFLATLSHELRTPMTAILGWSRVLEEGGLDEETFASAIESILHSAQAQALLIEDVLDMSRIISGKMQMDPQPVDLADAVQAAMRTVQPAADAKGVILEMQRRPGASLVTGDPNRLQQIVWNLLSNAIKFTPRGGEVVTRVEQSGSFVRLTVRDTGKGIGPEFLPHVFEPFRQAENVTTRIHGGLGLGLAIARQLVELHGGNISAQSEGEGKGATFVIELPVRAVRTIEAAQPASLDRLARRPANISGDTAYPSLAGARVLVVDDQADARILVKTVLGRCGANVTTAASVSEAVGQLERGTTDIVVSDIAMPDADGFELIRHIRETRKLSIPVIAMTAFGHAADQEKILAAGFTGYLKKPVEPIDLARELYTVLQRTRGT
jgi:PAS domain S-box-containing protein